LGNQAHYCLYRLCGEETYKKCLSHMNLTHMKLLTNLQRMIGICCFVGIPLQQALRCCISTSYLVGLGSTKHLFDKGNDNIMTLLLHFVTSGKLFSNKHNDDMHSEFQNIGKIALRDQIKDLKCFDFFSDPAMLQYNKECLLSNLETWLVSAINYDSKIHKSITSLIEDCSDDITSIAATNRCDGCGLYTLDEVGKMKTRSQKSDTTCNNCAWYRTLSG
jgi:hypothetical protein